MNTGGPRKFPNRKETYQAFFQHLIEQLRERHNFPKPRAPETYVLFKSGFPGIYYGMGFNRGGRVNAGVAINLSDTNRRKAIFDALAEQKDLLSAEFREEFKWEPCDNEQTSRINVFRSGSIEDDTQTLKDIEEWAIDRLLRFRKVFTPKLEELFGRCSG